MKMEWGVLFVHNEDGQLHLAREGGHSHHQIVLVTNMARCEIEKALLTIVRIDPNISMFENHIVINFLTL
jgi:L-aspartate oxidase